MARYQLVSPGERLAMIVLQVVEVRSISAEAAWYQPRSERDRRVAAYKGAVWRISEST